MSQTTKRRIGELLRRHRLNASLKQAELGDLLGYDHSHVSRVERGLRLPTQEYVQQFIQALHLPEAEAAEIMRLFQEETTEDEAPAPSPPPKFTHRQDWGAAPDVSVFYGRQNELAQLTGWVVNERCRAVAVLGMGGIGKTTLVTKLARQTRAEFDYVIWRSLRNAPPPADILDELLQFLADQPPDELPKSLDRRLALLIDHLRQHRCLLILDNAESILQEGQQAGHYQEAYEAYGQLIRQVGQSQHQSCLVLTSREKPNEFASLEGETAPVRSFQLSGLAEEEGREILKDKALLGSDESWATLNRRYSGNPLALKLVSETIREIFGGDIAGFLAEEDSIFGGVREILGQQFDRLSTLARSIMYWLAIEREAISLENLREDIIHPGSSRDVLEALSSLGRRSLIERSGLGITLQNVVMEYVTGRLIDQIYQELIDAEISLFQSHALLKGQAKDYIRESQIRLVLKPLVDRLLAAMGQAELETNLDRILAKLRQTTGPQKPGYAGGNILNILIYLQSDLNRYDFSNLTIWQAYLRDVTLNDLNFNQANLAKSVFTDTFGGIFSVAFSPEGKQLAAGTMDSEIRLWQVVDSKQLLICQGHTAWVRSVAFSPDGSLLASGSSDHTIRLWDVSDAQAPGAERCLKILQGHRDRVRAVGFHPGGDILVSGSGDGTIRLWDFANPGGLDTGRCFKTLEGHDGAVRSLAIGPRGELIASGGSDRTVRVWDIANARASGAGRCLAICQGHQDRVDVVAFHPAGQMVASGSRDRTVKLWDIGSLDANSSEREPEAIQPLQTFQEHSERIRAIAFSPDGSLLASGSNDRTVKLWDIQSGICVDTLRGHTNWIRSVTFSPDGLQLVSGGDDKTIRFWDVRSRRCLNTLRGYTNQVWSIAFSPDGRSLASGSGDQSVRLWEISTGRCLRVLPGHANWVWSVAFSADGQILASCGDDQTIRLWDVGSGECIRVLTGHQGRVSSVAFDPDSRRLASGGADRTIRLWDIQSGQALNVLQGHTERVLAVDFKPNSRLLASSSEDQTVKLWDVEQGQLLTTLPGHTSRVRSVAFAPAGDLLASSSDDGTIKLWATKSGLCLKTLRSDRPYERMNISAVSGLTEAQKANLKALGAVEDGG